MRRSALSGKSWQKRGIPSRGRPLPFELIAVYEQVLAARTRAKAHAELLA